MNAYFRLEEIFARLSAEAIADLAAVQSEILSSPEVSELIELAAREYEQMNEWQQANFCEMLRIWEQARDIFEQLKRVENQNRLALEMVERLRFSSSASSVHRSESVSFEISMSCRFSKKEKFWCHEFESGEEEVTAELGLHQTL